MWWRITRSEFDREKGPGNRTALKKLVESGQAPGLLAYVGSTPVGWVSVAPRSAYRRLDASRFYKSRSAEGVWSIPCFFVRRDYRGRGVALALLRAAVSHARRLGARLIEGYPLQPRKKRIPDVFAYTGTRKMFEDAEFKVDVLPSPTRAIMIHPVRHP